MDLLLIRHGQTDWNPIGRVMGANPIPLNAKGLEQVQNLRCWLQTIDISHIYTSPMQRAVQTAENIAHGREIPVVIEEGVAEIDYGDWVEKTFEEVRHQYPEAYNAYRFTPSSAKIPGGEYVPDAQKRAVAAIERLREKHSGERIAVVSHADVIKAILVHYLHFPLDLLQKVGCDNGSLSIYRFGTEWGDRLVALNYFADVKKILP